jgi:small subunit ribosomal protein S16
LEEYVVRIRLSRRGKKKQPTYRVVVADARSPRDGKFIEIIGNYNPVQQPKLLNIDTERARYWLSVGAQPSDTVVYLLKQVGVDTKPGTSYTPSTSEVLQSEAESAQPQGKADTEPTA